MPKLLVLSAPAERKLEGGATLMGVFIICRGRPAGENARTLETRLAAIGLTLDTVKDGEGECILFERAGNKENSVLAEFPGRGFLLQTGMFSYNGRYGDQARKDYFDDFNPRAPQVLGTSGHFCLVVGKAGTTAVVTDRLGVHKVYHDKTFSVVSNAFIGVAESIGDAQLDAQGCYQYAWNGATFGERTLLRDVATLPPGHAAVLTADGAGTGVSILALPAPDLGETEATDGSAERLVDLHLERGRALFRLYREWFGDRINLSFSGGYDSRLLLALLVDAGITPRMFVYGRPGETECRIASLIAEGEGLGFELVDKSDRPIIPVDAYAEYLARDYALFDGWKSDGLFDNGADGPDRAARVRGGLVKMNGGVGEIYRNFFYLPNRRYSPREIVWTFYSRYDPRVCTALFDAGLYEREVAEEIRKAVGAEGGRLSRGEVELVYPLFRARYWTAREVVMNESFGPSLFPFLEPSLIKGTCDIPISLKSYGIFEGRMIRRLNRRIAAYPSIYGHSFAADPPLAHRAKAQLSYLRPPLLRRYAYRLRHVGRQPRPYYLQPDYLRAAMDPDFPITSRLFRVDAMNDCDLFNRVATIEYLAQRIGARVP